MKDVAVKLENISKRYTLYHEKPTLVENVLKKGRREEFWALRDVNLIIKKGESIGIIGPNGSGKSSVLKIISGITKATSGKVETQGKVISLIELGAGFQPEFTGEENIYLNGMIIGMGRKEVKDKLRRIIKFADIGGFIDTPIYTYSDGMRLRLGFAIAVHSDLDTLVLDENIAVGDADFKKKSREKIKDFIEQGKTLIIASHSLELLREIVQRIVWLDKGKIKDVGKTNQILGKVEKIYL
jgi:ABC-type polysaccharide/polyol phosphate transport system ATPase subunit